MSKLNKNNSSSSNPMTVFNWNTMQNCINSGTHIKTSAVETMNLDKYKSLLNLKSDRTKKEDWILTIKRVDPILEGSKLVGYLVESNKRFPTRVYFDGTFCKKRKQFRQIRDTYSIVNVSAPSGGTSFTAEEFILLMDSIYNDRIPTNISELEANVKDASGMECTRIKRDLRLNYQPWNLEWVTHNENNTHRDFMSMIWEKTHKVWSVTATDIFIEKLALSGTAVDIERYMLMTGYRRVR